jgi:hypothetical protein
MGGTIADAAADSEISEGRIGAALRRDVTKHG